MTRKIIFFLMLAILALSACGKKKEVSSDGVPGMASGFEMSRQEATNFLAYEHYVSIETKEEELTPAYQKTITACINDKENNCTILDSKISTGTYVSADIKLRIQPKGVKGIIDSATSRGNVISESTHVEDLALPIADNEKRLLMLESHRDNLLALQEKAANDIESLIKISAEISKVQADIESAKGSKSHLHQRVNMDIVNIDFRVVTSRSFWKPISQSLSQFSCRLSEGISDTLHTVAYLIPWLIVITAAIFFFRFLWKLGRKSKIIL